MKKTFILTLFMMLCSFTFGQAPWAPTPWGDQTMVVEITPKLNGEVLPSGDRWTLGAFIDGECVASEKVGNPTYMVLNYATDPITGNTGAGKSVSFKLYDNGIGATFILGYELTFNPNNDVVTPIEINSRPVAQTGAYVYESLQEAINACVLGDNTVTILNSSKEDVRIEQKEGINIVIDGWYQELKGTIAIDGKNRSNGTETLTIQNVKFVAETAGDIIYDVKTGNSYAHNVTIQNCNFTSATGSYNVVAARFEQSYNIQIIGGEFSGLHSVLQGKSSDPTRPFVIDGITVNNCQSGIALTTSYKAVVRNSEINVSKYGIRLDGSTNTNDITIEDCEINAYIPVVLRNANVANYNITIEDDNVMTQTNNDGYWFVIGDNKHDYEDGNIALPATTTGKVVVNASDYSGIYGNTVAQVKYSDNSVKYFTNINKAVPNSGQNGLEGATITLLSNCEGKGLRFWKNNMTFDLGGKTFTINAATGSSGTETSGFQIRPEVTETTTIQNGTIAVKEGVNNVVWMFNNYAKQFNLNNLTVDCANMDYDYFGTDVYALVGHQNNLGNTTFGENVEFINFNTAGGNLYALANGTSLTTAQEGLNIDVPEGSILKYDTATSTYSVMAAVAAVNGVQYASIKAAHDAESTLNGATITLLADVTEDVTFTKAITFDGAEKNYTGKIKVSGTNNITVQNVNFNKGSFEKTSNSVGGVVTIKNCDFIGGEGEELYGGYAINVGRANKLVVEDCSASNYQYHFIYIPLNTATVSVKNVVATNVTGLANIKYGNNASFENVTVEGRSYGIFTQNYGAKTITIKNSNIKAQEPLVAYHIDGKDNKDTFKFEGVTEINTSDILSAGDYGIIYGTQAGTKVYGKLADAVAAENTTSVKLLGNETGSGLKINKSVAIDLNDKTYTINQAVGSTGTESQGFQLLKGNNVTIKNGKVDVVSGTHVVWMFNAYANLTLEGVTVNCANMAETEGYSQYVLVANNGGDATPEINYSNVTINGFTGAPLYLDPSTKLVAGAGLESQIETIPNYVVVYEDGAYTAEGAVAEVNGVQYASVADAHKAASAGATITLLADVTEDVTVSKNVTIDGAGKTYTGKMSLTSNKGNVTIKNVNFDGNGYNGYAVEARGVYYLTIEDCTAKNYGYGFVQQASATVLTTVKNVTVSNMGYGVKVDYGTDVVLENVKMSDVTTGILDSNYGDKTYTIKNCEISSIAIWERAAAKTTTFKFEGENIVNELTTSEYAKFYGTQAGTKIYGKLADAVAKESTVKLLGDETGSGIVINKDLTINFGGKTYTINAPVGSTGTASNGFQILKGNNVTLTNGTLNVAADKADQFYILVQNYANLNVVNMTLDGTNLDKWSLTDGDSYVLSNNSGIVNISGNTSIKANNDGDLAFAFDACDKSQYYALPTVTVNTTGEITGKIEVSATLIVENGIDNTKPININGVNGKVYGTNLNVTTSIENYIVSYNDVEEYYFIQGTQVAEIYAGWNWFSHYRSDDVLGQLQSKLQGHGANLIKTQSAFTQYKNNAWSGNLTSTNPAEMYMIHNNERVTINIEGEVVNPAEHPIGFHRLWNWIGYPLTEELSVSQALNGLTATDGDIIKSHGGYFSTFVEEQGWTGDLNKLEPGQGYMYYSYRTDNAIEEFAFSYPRSKEAVKANVTSANNYWVSNVSSFATNMTMMAVLSVDGNEMKEGVEVAAFVNGEVRGSARPVYVEAIDRYVMFLSICGEDGEEVSFKYVDLYTEEEYAIDNKVVYSENAIIGTVRDLYELVCGTMGIGENAANTISIYPNPTTTNTAISFETVCDMVEVFNSLGAKVAEYSNVDRIDGVETAGVYVIRVTNGSTVQNCRLIVK